MADFGGTVSLVKMAPAFGGHPGALVVKIALSAATYGSGDVNLSGIAGKITQRQNGIRPADLYAAGIMTEGNEGYMVDFTRAATPTWAAVGALTLRTATGTEETGTETITVYITFTLFGRTNIV